MAAPRGHRPGLTWPEYAEAWSALHGGFDPDAAMPVVRGWIRLAYRGGGLLARAGIGPAAVTGSGLLLCLATPFAALSGPGGLLLAALLVLLAALADALDGAVAVVAGRTSRLGFVYDSVADRLGELAWLAAFWVAGAPGWLVAAGAAVSWLHEYVRARAAAGGMAELGVVTVGERPTRVAVAITGLLVAGAAGFVHPGWDATVAVAAAVCWAVLGLAGLAQLAVAVRRALAG
jgi:CDP-diacylglycerol--glycerol-3-phosphate 3-phosphatidyltransferase